MKKISMRQGIMIVAGMIFSPAVRLFSSFVSGMGNQASWIAPVFSGLFMLLFMLVLWSLIKENRNFYQHLEYSFGSVISKIVAVLYIIWGVLLTSIQMRYYSQRVASTIYTEIAMDVFVIILVGICVYSLKNGISVLARMNELLLPLIAVVAIFMLALLTPDIKVKVLVPVNDWASLVHVSVFNVASFGYLSFILFFVDEINDKESFKKHGIISICALTLFSVWLFITVIGTLGPHIIEKLPYPFFAVVKQISLGEFLQHIEAFVITLWILSDFVLISFIGATTVKIYGNLTRSRDLKEFYLPFFTLCAILVSIMGRTNHELEVLSEKLFIPLNLIFLFVIPFIVFFVGKIKQKIIANKGKNMIY